MANSELNIVLKLIDGASPEIKKVWAETEKDVDNLKKKTQEANKSVQNEFKKSAQGLRSFRRDLILVVSVLFSVVNATREYAKYNAEARESVNEFDAAITKMSANAGKALMPVLKILSMSAEGWAMLADVAGNVFSGKGFVLDVDTDSINAAIEAAQKLKDLSEQQKLLNEQFLSGQITSGQYYDKIISSENSLLQMRQMAMSQMQEMANLTALVNNQEMLLAETRTQGQIDLLHFYASEFKKAHASMAEFTVTIGEAIQTNLSGALTNIITSAESAKEAFANLGQAMVKAVVDFIVQKLVASAIEKALLATTVATTTAAATAIAAAWLPAATLASIATMGGAAAAGATGLSVASVASVGILTGLISASKAVGGITAPLEGIQAGMFGIVKHMGGMIRAHSGLAVDEVPIIAQTGEGILSRRGMANLGGASVLNALNRGESSGIGNVSVNVYYPKMSSREETAELAKVLGIEINRQLRYSRGV